MNNYVIIDSHSHVFPEKIASKATASISKFYGIEMYAEGTASNLLSSAASINAEKVVIHSTATTVQQVQAINNFIIENIKESDKLIGYMTLHPAMTKEQIVYEIDRCIEQGLLGIKLHSDFQQFNADDPAVYKMYEAASGRLPILFHSGDKRFDYSHPIRLSHVSRDFPNLQCIIAHLGGYTKWSQVAAIFHGQENVYFDTCSALPFLAPDNAANLMHELGIEKIFFAVDFPMWRHDKEVERFLNLPLTEEERNLIFHLNYKRFMNL